jgi:hypothetical protein
MVSQINVAGYKMDPSAPLSEWSENIASFFGKQGLETGGDFLKHLVDENQVSSFDK